MSKFKTNVIYKVTKEKKGNGLELGNLYFINVPATYAQVHKPAKKLNSEDTSYQMNVFIDKESMDKAFEIGVNKKFAEVGVTKKEKGANRGQPKYPLDEVYGEYEGMFGAQLTADTVKRDAKTNEVTKKYEPIKVIDKEFNEFTDNIGNGSICTVKLFCYRNNDGMLNTRIDTVQVIEHVPYEGGENDGYDEVMGGTIKYTKSSKKDEEDINEPDGNASPEPSDNYDDDIPF